MAHFAKIQEDGTVENVLVIANDDCGGGVFPESEPVGQAFIASLGFDGVWKQTSYNTYRDENGVSQHLLGGTPFRGEYAHIGGRYDAVKDEFVTPFGFYDTASTPPA